MKANRHAAAIAAITALATALALALPVSAGGPAPTTRFVDDDGLAGANGCDGSTVVPRRIQPAINQANEGDTILVCPGDYTGFSIDEDADHPDGLTVRSVIPWEARVISDSGEFDFVVIGIEGAADATIQWLTVLARTSNCGGEPVDTLIRVSNSFGTQLRANHLGTLGDDTLGDCGYRHGIDLDDSDNVELAWNRIVDFRNVGIVQDAGEQTLNVGIDIHGNTLRYFHEGAAPLANVGPSGVPDQESIGIKISSAEGIKIARNWIRSLPGAGDTSPQLDRGIDCGTCSLFVPMELVRNRVLHVNEGIDIGGAANGSVIRGNRVRSSGEVGLFIDNMDNSTIENNLVKGGDLDGIVLGGDFGFPGIGPEGNAIQNNDFRNNGGTDCIELGFPIDNNWDDETNLGDDANQGGLCTPGTVIPPI